MLTSGAWSSTDQLPPPACKFVPPKLGGVYSALDLVLWSGESAGLLQSALEERKVPGKSVPIRPNVTENLMYYRHIFLASLPMLQIFCTNHEGPTQAKMKDIFSVDKRRNDLKSHISTLRDDDAVSGESGMSCSIDVPWTTGVASASGDVEPNPCPPRARSGGGGGEYLCVDISAEIAANFRRAWDMFDIFFLVARTVCRLHMDSSSLSTLPRDT